MWFNNIAKGLQEHVEKAGQDLGLKETLANAQAHLGTLSEDLLDVKAADSGVHQELLAVPNEDEHGNDEQGNRNGWGVQDGSEDPVQDGTAAQAGNAMDRQGILLYKQENAVLRQELRELKMAAADALGEVEELKEKLAAGPSGGTDKDEQIAQLHATNDRLDARLTAAEEKSASMEQAARLAMDESSQLRSELRSLKDAFKGQETEHVRIVEDLRAQLQESKAPTTPESKLRPSSNSTSTARSPDGVSGQSQSEDAQSEVQSMKAKLQKAKRTLDNMKKRESEALAAKAQVEAQNQELQAQLSQAVQSSDSTKEKEELEARCQRLQSQVVDLEHDLSTVTERYETSRREEGSESESLSSELNELRSQLQKSEHGRSEAQQKLSDLRMTLEDSKQKIAGIQSLRDELEGAKKARLEAADQKSQAEQQSLKAEQALEALHDQLSTESGKLSDLQTALDEARADSDTKTNHIHRLEKEHLELQTQTDSLHAQITELTAARERSLSLESSLKETQDRLSDSQDTVVKLEAELAEARTFQQAREHDQAGSQTLQVPVEEDSHVEEKEGTAEEGANGVSKKVRKRNRKKGNKAPVSQQAEEPLNPREESTLAHNGIAILPPISTATESSAHLTGLSSQQGLQGNPLYSPGEVAEPCTPPARESSSSSAELQEELRDTKEELERQRQLVVQLQEQLTNALGLPPGLSPRSLTQNHAFGSHRIVGAALKDVKEEASLAEKEAGPQEGREVEPSKEADLLKAQEDLEQAKTRITELEDELRLRSRLGELAAKVSALEEQQVAPSRAELHQGVQPQGGTFSEGITRPSSGETSTSEGALGDQRGPSPPGEPSKQTTKRKSKEQLGTVQQRIMSLEEQLMAAKQSARLRGALEHRTSSLSDESADVTEVKHQLQVARQDSQELASTQEKETNLGARKQDSHTAAITSLVEKLKGDLTAACETRDTALQEAKALTVEVERLQGEVGEMQAELIRHQQASQERDEKLSAKNEEVLRLHGHLESAERKYDELQFSNQNSAQCQDEHSQAVRDLQAEREALHKQLEDLRLDHARVQSEHESANESADEALSRKDQKIAALQVNVDEHQQKLIELSEELTAACRARDAHQTATQDLQASNTELQRVQAELSQAVNEKENQIASLKEELRTKESAIEAVRDGSNAELKMAVNARKQAENRCSKAEEAVKQLRQELSQAEDRVEAAMKEARQNQERAQARLQEAREETVKVEEREQKLQAQLQQAQHDLQSSKKAAQEAAQAATGEAKREAMSRVEGAVKGVREEAEAMRTELLGQLQALRSQLEEAGNTEQALRDELSHAQESLQTLTNAQAEISRLARELDASKEAERQSLEKAEAAEKLEVQEKMVALERQKRFNVLNGQFRKKEAAFAKDLQAIQTKVEERDQALHSLRSKHSSVKEELETKTHQLTVAKAAAEKAREDRNDALQQLEAAQQELTELKREFKAQKARLKDLEDQSSISSHENVEQKIQAAVQDAKADSEARLREAEAAVRAAREEVEVANERASAAELAKIQLSMQIAELDDARAAQVASKEPLLGSPRTPQELGLETGPSGVVQLGGLQESIPSTKRFLDIFGCAVNDRH